MSPMCQYSAINGFATDWHLVHYGSRAAGGVSLIIQEATAVSPEGRITPADLGIWDDAHIEKLSAITCFISNQNCVPGIQLAHAGRKASCEVPWKGGRQLSVKQGGWQTVSSSQVAFFDDDELPLALKKSEITQITDFFRLAAVRAVKAGFKVIEIHAAHGYLIHQFLSPLCNNREDEYGGSFENRIRFLVEITDSVKSVLPPDIPLFVRISATDWVENGWDTGDSVKLSEILKHKGVYLIDCSSGGTVPWAKIPFSPGYQVKFSERIKSETGILTSAVGLITNRKQAEEILESNSADLLFVGRKLLSEPNFTLQMAKETDAPVDWPNQYLRVK